MKNDKELYIKHPNLVWSIGGSNRVKSMFTVKLAADMKCFAWTCGKSVV
ncbi:hypothetical protein CLV98_107105 [Dyadobacter jejuensis]|uniref:Uncharacterized protein n=1 Tax=Dyadobacter jejuensis TaxID=1082580 RepID=A0A316AJB1_9BACT|nr:hypothetical protein CLV98_107105 [Dyadobacter jejuensis]